MQASVRQAVSVNITPPVISGSSRETAAPAEMRMTISRVNFWYGAKQTLFDINLGIATSKVTALIGPSGCGKSTLLRTLDRMHETVRNARLEGEILLDGKNILAQDVTLLRRRIGMVFQRPNPFPKSIFENVAYGLRINGSKIPIAAAVEKSLRHAALWDEVKDHLHKPAYELSGGQQQLLVQLKDLCTIITVTPDMRQAARISDFTAFLLTGQLIEFSPTPQLFTKPSDPRTEAYITGRFG